MRHTLIAWVLMVAAGGEGFHSTYHAPVPFGVFTSAKECDIARGGRIKAYRAHLVEPIRSGYDFIEGGVDFGLHRTASRQLYILTCEPTKGR